MERAHNRFSCLYTTTDGLRLHAFSYGDEFSKLTPVVCLSGLARTALDFEPLAIELAKTGRRVLAIDYRGRGDSEWDANPKHYNLWKEGRDIRGFLKAESISQAIFIGTSRGGLHIMLLGLLRPSLIKAAVINDIGPTIEMSGLMRIKGYVGKLPPPRDLAHAVELLKAFGEKQFTAFDDEAWHWLAHTTWRETANGLEARYDPNLSVALRSLMKGKKPPSLWALFWFLRKKPLLVLRGENSDILSAETLIAMQLRHPRCETYTVEGQGHAPSLRDQASIQRILDFIAPF